MSFPDINCPLRTDESFRQKLDEDHVHNNVLMVSVDRDEDDRVVVGGIRDVLVAKNSN